MEQLAPTKTNLFKLKKLLKTAVEGYSLLDRKRNVLIHELLTVIDDVKKLESEFSTMLASANQAIHEANILCGSNTVTSVAGDYVTNDDYSFLSKSVMGVSIPTIKRTGESERELKHNSFGSGIPLDNAICAYKNLADLAIRKAAVETTVIRLAKEIKTTQKRANALNNILIPTYSTQIKFIVEFLEEKEREEFFKVKLIKKKKQ